MHDFVPTPRYPNSCQKCGRIERVHDTARAVVISDRETLQHLNSLLILNLRPWNRKLKKQIEHALEFPEIPSEEQLSIANL